MSDCQRHRSVPEVASWKTREVGFDAVMGGGRWPATAAMETAMPAGHAPHCPPVCRLPHTQMHAHTPSASTPPTPVEQWLGEWSIASHMAFVVY